MERKQRTAAKKVRDLVNQIRKGDSDFDDFESSGDEFKLRKCDLNELSLSSSECESSVSDDFETLYQLKKKLKTKSLLLFTTVVLTLKITP